MTTAQLTATDIRVREAVMHQLEWESEVDASAVGVAARDGTITLTGYVDTYAGKLAAERAAKLVHGVRAIANDIDVRPMMGRTDTNIASDVAAGLRLRSTVPETVQAAVHHGQVSLTGRVDWLFQKQSAEAAATHVRGVTHVMNHIEVAPRAVIKDVRRRIVRSLHRHADLDAGNITVTVEHERATLSGTVESWHQRELAERAVADAPGVTQVDNQLVVVYAPRPDREALDDPS